jgi:ferredoxin-NADP reductase
VTVDVERPTDAGDGGVTSALIGGPAMPMVFREQELDLRVARREVVADDVVALTLVSPDGDPLPAWTPGAHIDLVLDPSLVRQYSLCGVDPKDDTSWRIGVLRDPNSRGGSQAVHALEEGATIRARGPRNHFTLVDAPRYVFVAGGIGITPLLGMIASVERRGAQWQLTYGGRQRASMAFLDELAEYGDRVQLWPQDEKGLLDLPSILGDPRPDTLVYCCGPEGLLSAVEAACASWPAGSLHVERFQARALDPATTADQQFELVLQRSGITTVVPPDKTILDVVQQAGVSVLSSCRIGTCGTCEQAVVEGELDHRDSVLTEEDREAGEYMMICVSRACSDRLVLDL